ncbi:MAG TPA: hypothetical protein V6D06_18440 [Trichocoleus sp.]
MSNLIPWAFIALMGAILFLVLSETVLSGSWAYAAQIVCVVLGLLSGLLYGASTSRRYPED